MKVVTVTLNPAIDQTITLDHLTRGTVHRARDVRYDAGGKGVIVASCLADWGLRVTATGLVGKDNPACFEALFAAQGITDAFLRAEGATRTNIKLVDDGETTDVNLPGLSATPATLAAVRRALLERLAPGDLAVVAGSLPLGCPEDHYAELIAAVHAAGAHVLLDASGPALAAALAAPVLPWCIKPNRDELASWLGAPLRDAAAICAAARRLHAHGVALVVVSLGSEGAVFVSAEGLVRARLAATNIVTTVGAGDAMVAGIAAAATTHGDLAATARLATAFAVGTLGLRGPHVPPRATLEQLATTVELDLELSSTHRERV